MASKSYSFRLPQEVVEIVEARRKEGESSNQALQREIIEFLKSGIEVRNEDNTSIKKEIAEIVEMQTLPLQKRIEALEGKLSA